MAISHWDIIKALADSLRLKIQIYIIWHRSKFEIGNCTCLPIPVTLPSAKMPTKFRHHKRESCSACLPSKVNLRNMTGRYISLTSRHENCKIISRLYLQRDVIPICVAGPVSKLFAAPLEIVIIINMLMFIPIHLSAYNRMVNTAFNWNDAQADKPIS